MYTRRTLLNTRHPHNYYSQVLLTRPIGCGVVEPHRATTYTDAPRTNAEYGARCMLTNTRCDATEANASNGTQPPSGRGTDKCQSHGGMQQTSYDERRVRNAHNASCARPQCAHDVVGRRRNTVAQLIREVRAASMKPLRLDKQRTSKRTRDRKETTLQIKYDRSCIPTDERHRTKRDGTAHKENYLPRRCYGTDMLSHMSNNTGTNYCALGWEKNEI